eukprot:gene7718-13549_t
MTIRARSENGVLFYLGRGQYDYLGIELIKGEVHVAVQNGAGSYKTSVAPEPWTKVCDGKAHEISIVKEGRKVTVTVDSMPPKVVTGPGGSSSVDTGNELAYFGGISSRVTAYGMSTRDSFNGCILKYEVDGKDKTNVITPEGLA